MIRFKDLSGKEITEIETNAISDLIKFLWCCTVSACAREKLEFPLSMMEFADALDQQQLLAWQAAMQEAGKVVEEEQKKSPSE